VFITRLVTRSRSFITAGVLVLLLLNVASAFSTEDLWYRSAFRHVLTGIRHPPLVRSDIDEVDRMLGVLGNVLTEPGDRMYVLSGSAVLNSSMLRSAHLSLNRHREISKRLLRTSVVDRRDGFPGELLQATYILVADPVQHQLRPDDQRVLLIPAELVLAARGIGTSLVRLPYAFRLERSVTAYLYKKVRPFPDSDVQALSEMLRHYYPTRPEIYRVSER
jgi:hypothetical protein